MLARQTLANSVTNAPELGTSARGVNSALEAISQLDISVSHAGRCFAAPSIEPGESPLVAALVAMAALGDVSLCTPARGIRSL